MLGRTSGGFCDVVDLHFVGVVILYLLMFFIHFLFNIIPHLSMAYHHGFRPIPLYFQPSPSQSDSRHFHFSTILLSSYRECYGFEWVLFTHRHFFTLHSFPTFWYNLLLSRFHWESAATFFKVAGLHTDLQNKDPAHLFV